MADQALFAGSNFIVSLLLARWLESQAYGAVSLAYSLLLLVGVLQLGFFNEPMMVYGSGRFRNSFWSYKGVLAAANLRFGLGVGMVFLGMGIIAHSLGLKVLALAFWGYALAAPAVFSLWFEKQVVYVLLEPKRSAAAGAAYLIFYLGLATLFFKKELLNAFSAPVLMGVAAALAVSLMSLRAWKGWPLSTQGVNPRLVYTLHLEYGRWAAFTGVLSWAPGYLPFFVLPPLHGLEAVARLRALLNLLMPIWHFNGALSRLLLPVLVRAREQDRVKSTALRAFFIMAGFAVLFWSVLAFWGAPLMDMLYMGKYTEDVALLTWVGLAPVLGAAVAVLGAYLRAMENPRAVTAAYAKSLALGVPVMVVLSWGYGVGGSVAAVVLIEFFYVLFLLNALRKKVAA